jgi:hypothetical protein
MPFICYTPRRFSEHSRAIIAQANTIIREYQTQGLGLTLRQIYYQFVSRGWLPNVQAEYKRLGGILNDARMAGLVDWEAIEDRTRNLQRQSHWDNPTHLLKDAARQYNEDLWADQDYYVEVWIEKDALVGILDAVCPENDVPFFSCRGYTSQSEMWVAAMRLNRAMRVNNRVAVVIHLGDHDPSGVDMTRDIQDRLNTFSTAAFAKPPKYDPEWEARPVAVRRIALTIAQVNQYSPPPNPAKMTDSRVGRYIDEFGDESWELDALEPRTLVDLIQSEIHNFRDPERWEAAIERREVNRAKVIEAAEAMEMQ